MVKEGEEVNSSNADSPKLDDFKIDKTASIWNQLRLAWRDFHLAKKKEPKSETKRFEILISNLLKELGINLNENQMAEIFQLTVDKIPKSNYGDSS